MLYLIKSIALLLSLQPGEACFGRLSPAPRGISGGYSSNILLPQPLYTGDTITQIGNTLPLPAIGYSPEAVPVAPVGAVLDQPPASIVHSQKAVKTEYSASDTGAETPWHDYINSLTGGTVIPYDGQALSLVQNGNDLSCSFGGSERCCWHNVRNSADELDWSLTSKDINLVQLDGFSAANIPDMPALITGAPKTQRWVQAILTSCPIPCQSGDGQLTISHWLSPGVLLDVCRLKVGAREYLDCQQPLKASGRSTVVIPGLDEPFYVVLVASEFVGESWKYEGGVAIIDDLEYANAQICVPSSESTNQ